MKEDGELPQYSSRRGRRWRIERVVPTIVSLAGLVGIWWLLVATGTVSPYLVPDPPEVARALWEFRAAIGEAAWITLSEVLLGFGLAVIAGVLIAIVLNYSKLLNKLLYPPLILLHSIPKAAVAPLLLIWFGFGLRHKVILSLLIAFFPIFIALASGLRRIDPALHDLSRSLRASRFKTFWKIDLPFALPALFSGLRVASHLAVVGAVIAEFVAGDRGLAVLLRSSGAHYKTALSFACAIALAVMSAALFLVVTVAETYLVPWSSRES